MALQGPWPSLTLRLLLDFCTTNEFSIVRLPSLLLIFFNWAALTLFCKSTSWQLGRLAA